MAGEGPEASGIPRPRYPTYPYYDESPQDPEPVVYPASVYPASPQFTLAASVNERSEEATVGDGVACPVCDPPTLTDSPIAIGQPLASSSNVLLLFQLKRIRNLSVLSFLLAIICLFYLGILIVLMVLNSQPVDVREANKFLFHMLEFWADVVFDISTVLALLYSPKPLASIFYHTIILRFIIAVNVTVSLVPAILMAIDVDQYEYVSHNVVYANELTMAFIDMVIVLSLVREAGRFRTRHHLQLIIPVCVAILVCIAQLLVYNLMQTDEGEQISHFMEFSLDILSTIFTFWFCLNNKKVADKWIQSILYAGSCPPECMCIETMGLEKVEAKAA